MACVSGAFTRRGPRMAMPCSVAARLVATPAASPSRSAARATAIPPGSVSQNCPDGATRAPTNDTLATCARPSASRISGPRASGDGLRPRDVLVGVVARAHERPGGDVLEAQRVGRLLQRRELVGMPVAHDRQMAFGGAQVLPDGEDLHAVGAQGAEGVDHL